MVLKFDPVSSIISKYYDCNLWGHVGKKMRLSLTEKDLILKTDENQLTFLLDINGNELR